jgi:multidrug efflux pump subunit AcrB/outer membrane protein TolC
MDASNQMVSKLIETLIKYRRLVFSVVLLLIGLGLLALNSMARQEDPSFPYRNGLITVAYPGVSPLQIEKLITEPLEEELAQVSEIKHLWTVSRDNIAIAEIELKDSVYDTDAAWDRVQEAIDLAYLEFPEGVGQVELDDRRIDIPAAVFSIVGSDDILLLDEAAVRLKSALIGLPGISKIEIEGQPEKEVIVTIDQEMVNRLGISRQSIANIIAQRNTIIPGGVVSVGDSNIRLNTQSDYASLEELRRTMLSLPSGQVVSLQSIADVRIEPRLPLAGQVFDNGTRAVSVGITAQRGQVDLVQFGRELRARIETLRPTFAPLEIRESFFQADYVQSRLDNLQKNLIVSMLVIAAIAIAVMGWRSGILVSAVLPVVSLITLGLYSAAGNVFHQMAVIGIVISLGILIDNAIVVMEYIAARLRQGIGAGEAIRESIKSLAKPLLASTGTTVAAFIPLLMADGGVGDFTRAIPVMVMTAMIVSYLVSVFVVPLLAFYWLKPEPDEKPNAVFDFTDSLAQKCVQLVTAKPRLVLLAVMALLVFSVLLAPLLKQSFFPSTDRAQILLEIELPNNSSLELTSAVSTDIERKLLDHETVERIYRYVGGGGFRYYYNISGMPNESHVSRFTINTTSQSDNQALVDWVRDELAPNYPDVIFIPKLLGQGPAILAPIEIRVKHSDLGVLHNASQTIKSILQDTQGVTELRTNLDLGSPELRLAIQDGAVLSYGLQPDQVAAEVFAESRGLHAGYFRYDADPVPIRVRSSLGQRSDVAVIANQVIFNDAQQATPLSQLSSMQPIWTPTALRHHDHRRTVTVLSELVPGYAFNQVLAEFRDKLATVELPAGVIIEYGGDASASSSTNSSIAAAGPVAIGVLLFFMMFQFNSFRRMGIVFISIPLAAVGIIPGLVITGEPFGFTSLIGVIALAGIVVNNAIVLIDVVDQSLEQGQSIEQAVRHGLEKRTAPILLTTATTVFGLLPLALSSSSLWPPMAWAIISGLVMSTSLTLIAIPALCLLLLGRKQNLTAPIRLAPKSNGVVPISLIAAMCVVPLFSDQAQAADAEFKVSKESILATVENNAGAVSQMSQAKAAELQHQANVRQTWFPKLTLGGAYSRRDEATTLSLPQPIGQVSIADESSYNIEAKLTQPIFNLSTQRYDLAVSSLQQQSVLLNAQAYSHRIAGQALTQYYRLLELVEVRGSLQKLEESLTSRLDRINKQIEAGRALKTDQLQVQVSLNRIKQQLFENSADYLNLEALLRNQLGLAADRQLSLMPLQFDSLDDVGINEIALEPQLSCLSRLDCKAITLESESSSLRLKSAKAGYLPKLDLSLTESRNDGLLFGSDRDKRVMLEFSWPLFLGGKRQSEISAAEYEIESLDSRLLGFQQDILVEVKRADNAIQTARTQFELASSSVELDEERLRLSRIRYENGLLNVDELLDAEASLAQSRSDLASAKLNWLSALATKAMATGEPY